VFTGLVVFDEYWGGFCGGDLIVLAARTSIGKTALALGIAEHNAQNGRPVLFITLEMRDSELIDRTLSRLTGCSLAKLRNGQFGESNEFRLTAEDFERLNQAADSLEDVGLFVHDRPSIKTSEIRAAAKLTQARHGLSLLVVDMVNLVKPDDPKRDRHEQLGQITRDLKALAKELNVPILLLAQINREAEKSSGEPSLIHLKESGSLEENADMVMLLHRADRMTTEGKLIVAKNRHGQVNKMDLEFVGDEIQFRCKSNEWKP
jgi:replicative DNA helicase